MISSQSCKTEGNPERSTGQGELEALDPTRWPQRVRKGGSKWLTCRWGLDYHFGQKKGKPPLSGVNGPRIEGWRAGIVAVDQV